jgi:hypothetical protein
MPSVKTGCEKSKYSEKTEMKPENRIKQTILVTYRTQLLFCFG